MSYLKNIEDIELVYFDKETNQTITISDIDISDIIRYFEDGIGSWSYRYSGKAARNDKDSMHVALVRNCYEVIKFSLIKNTQGSVGRKTSSGELDILSTLGIKAKNAISYSRSYWSYQDDNNKWHLMLEDESLQRKLVFDFQNFSKIQLKEIANRIIFEITDTTGAEEIYALENNSFMLEYKDKIDMVLLTGKIVNLWAARIKNAC